jgi:regulator of sigma E protease
MSHFVYVVGIVGLLLLVLVHEAGHFVAARLVGMKPTKFYLGFPPAIAKRVRGGIEYGIGAIPLGGYVKIPGMFRPSERDVERYFGPLVADDTTLGPLVEDVRTGVARSDEKSTREAIDALERRLATLPSAPLVRLASSGIEELRDGLSRHAYWRQSTWRRVVVIAAGPFANLVAALILLAAVNMLGVPTAVSQVVAEVKPGSPAAAGGIHPGDAVIQINGKWLSSAQQAHDIVQHAHGRPVHVTVFRAGKAFKLSPIKPRKISGDYLLGFQWGVQYRKDSPPRAVARASSQTWSVVSQIVTGLPLLVQPKHREEVSSVVGIVSVSGEALRTDYRDYLGVVALISLSLAVLNLLPFLPLDGGHILVALVERLRRRALRRELVERFSFVGFALVGLLMYIGLTNDAHRYF